MLRELREISAGRTLSVLYQVSREHPGFVGQGVCPLYVPAVGRCLGLLHVAPDLPDGVLLSGIERSAFDGLEILIRHRQ